MNKPNIDSEHNKAKLGLIFIGLAFGIILLVLGYFYHVLQPKLHHGAQSQAQMITQSLGNSLKHRHVLQDAFLLQREIGKILLYNDGDQGEPFVKGLIVEFNPDIFPNHSPTLQRGETHCSECFEIVTPLYDQQSLQLLGNAIFYVNSKTYLSLVKEISQKFFLVLVLLGMILFIIWAMIRQLWQKSLQSQQQLIQSNHYNQQILDTMQDLLFLVDHEGQIIDANKTAQEHTGEPLKQLQDQFIQKFIKCASNSKLLLNQIQDSNKSNLEVKLTIGDKEDHIGLLSASDFHFEDQNKSGHHYLLVIKDIQALKTAESRLAYQAQMAHAGRLKSLGEMATGIAHEINQPLAAIRLGAEGIKFSVSEHNPHAFEAEIAQDLIEQVDRISRIITNMRSFARLQSTPKKWVKLYLPLESALSFFKEQLRINNIQLVEHIALDCPEVLIESQKFEQVIVNLIGNARDALNEIDDERNKKIVINLSCDAQKVVLQIKDNGIGMDKSTLDHCLDPFFTTKDAGEGTGLGLSIVHTILQEFNIKLTIESDLSQGTCFEMQIPHKYSEISK